jgi:hypothetical protein
MKKLALLLSLVGAALVVAAAPVDAASLTTVASGSFTILGPEVGAPNGINRTFSFSAKEASDGNVTGQMALRTFSANLAHGTITCMTVEGNQAILGGTYTQFSQDPTQVGNTFAFAIQSNPDMATFVNFPFGATPCQDFLTANNYANIQAVLDDQGFSIPRGSINIKQLG